MKNITNNFNEIIIGKTLSSQQNSTQTVTNEQFSSLLNNGSTEQQETEQKEHKEESENITNQQLELQNTSYLNKILLSSVA